MSNPLSLLPFALAAGNGRMDGVAAPALVAAGFTLLQRSAPLVRAMAGRRSAIALPPSAAVLVALAASDGRAAVLLDLHGAPDEVAGQLTAAEVGVVFTTRAMAEHLPPGEWTLALLDDAPRSATVVAQGIATRIDLGTHFGLALEGEESDGADDACVVAYSPHGAVVLSHRNLLSAARGAIDATSMLALDHLLAMAPLTDITGFAYTVAAPLLAGARVTTQAQFDAAAVVERIERDGVTMLVARPTDYEAVLAHLTARGAPLVAPALRVCVATGIPTDQSLQTGWHDVTGVELRCGFGLTEAPMCLFNVPHFPNRRGTAGIPFPGVQVAVRAFDTHAPLATGCDGELCVRGAQVARHYMPGARDALQVQDGWLLTRVGARERADGAYELVERTPRR